MVMKYGNFINILWEWSEYFLYAKYIYLRRFSFFSFRWQ